MKKTVIITGGTRGIGRAIALKLATQDYRLVLNYRADDERARRTAAECQEHNPDVVAIKADVSSREDVAHLIDQTKRRFETIDALINNAGRNVDKPLGDLSEEDWDTVVDANMKGVFFCSQMASQEMLRQEDGGIILNVAASTAIRGRVNGINYCASKAGVLAMTKCLALELAPHVRVNCIIPGSIYTEETVARRGYGDPEVRKQKERKIPLRRIGTPEEVADVASFLMSNGARYIHGQVIIVDGGQFMY